MGGTRYLIGGWLQSDRDVRVCWRQTEGRRGQFLSLHVCMCWPVMMRHSLCSRASVKRRDTMSSGLMRKRISSWTNPRPVTPPPTILFAKSTCGTRGQTQRETHIHQIQNRPAQRVWREKMCPQFHPWTWCEMALRYRDRQHSSDHFNSVNCNFWWHTKKLGFGFG